MSDKYILDGHEPKPVDLMTWARWFESNRDTRHVAVTDHPLGKVSTVFLGLDHSFGARGAPLLFETMVFGGAMDGEMDRYATWDEAEAGHAAMVARVLEPSR